MTIDKYSLLIYGADSAGKILHVKLLEFGMSPVGFIDDKITGIVDHLPVYSPDNCPDLLKNIPILISIPYRTDSDSELEKVLILNGWKSENILTFPQFYLYTKRKGWYLPASFWTGMISVLPPPPKRGPDLQNASRPDIAFHTLFIAHPSSAFFNRQTICKPI